MKQFNNSFLHIAKLALAGAALALFVAALASLGGFAPDPARAEVGNAAVSGYAWSSNIGWISFNGSNYGVTVDATSHVFSGYAWSSNIGWINFGPTSDFPESGADAHAVQLNADNTVTGWARACAVFQIGCAGTLKPDTARGGWDGWLKMSGASPDYGVTLNTATNKFEGYAWGGDPIGWLSMSGTSPDYAVVYGGTPVTAPAAPQVTLCVEVGPDCFSSASIASGGNASIRWNVKNLQGDSCTVSDVSGNPATWISIPNPIPNNDAGGTETISAITTARTYTLTCGGASSAPVSINLDPFISYFLANGESSDTIFIGQSAMLSWGVANILLGDSCSIDHGVGVADVSTCANSVCSGSTSVSPVSDTTYTLSCSSIAGGKSVTVFAHASGFFLEAENDQDKIRITSIGRQAGGAVGTGGKSTSAFIEIHADSSFQDSVRLSFSDQPQQFDDAGISSSIYKFRIITPDGTAGSIFTGATGITVPAGQFWNNGYKIEFWVESTAPLPPLGEGEIKLLGEDMNSANGTAAPDMISIFLDSRLFDPKYKEI